MAGQTQDTPRRPAPVCVISPYYMGYLAYSPDGRSRMCPFQPGDPAGNLWAAGFHERYDDEQAAKAKRYGGRSYGRPNPAPHA